MKRFKLDARDLPCPRPLLKTKEAMETEDFEIIDIQVNNKAARENVCRFLEKSGSQEINWEKDESDENGWIITANTSGSLPVSEKKDEGKKQRHPSEEELAGAGTILICSDKIGHGDDQLGTLLMKGFLYTLTQLDKVPDYLIFMNSGITRACEGSENLKDLQDLENKGCRILVCGTCLDYLKMMDQKRIGTVSNMYEITTVLTNYPKVLTIG